MTHTFLHLLYLIAGPVMIVLAALGLLKLICGAWCNGK